MTFRVDKIVRKEESEFEEKEFKESSATKNREEEEEEHPTVEKYDVHMNWLGSNPNPEIIVSDPTSNYFTFGEKGYENVKVKGYKKIVYKNLYSGIDVEYTIPEKGGIKYSLIVHPGADISKVKMQYSGDVLNMKIDTDGNIVITTPAGDIIDHAPVSYYENGNQAVLSSFNINDGIVLFSFPNNYNSQATLIIDPWTTTPSSLTNSNIAYDIAFDDFGNTYISGGSSPHKLAKYSSGGGLIWTFTNPNTTDWGNCSGVLSNSYSKFCVVPSSGTTYIGEGMERGCGFGGTHYGPRIMKIDNAGNLTYTTADFLFGGGATGTEELWLMFYNRCNNQLTAFGGGVVCGSNNILQTDVSLLPGTVSNFNGFSGCCNDVASVVMDDNGDFYALMGGGTGANHILKSLISTNYTPTCAFDVISGYAFTEMTNNGIPGLSGSCVSVRANALASNGMYLFSYDGKDLKAWTKTNGSLLGSITVNASYSGGGDRTHEGIAADECNNVYVGGTNMVHVYTFNGTAFTTQSSITSNIGTVLDLQLDETTSLLYACGVNFVTVTQVTSCPNQLYLTISTTSCPGSATVTVSGGTLPYTYLWSNNATTSTITGIPAGTYTVTVTDNTCIPLYGTATAIVSDSSMTVTISNDTSVCAGSTVSLTVSGGATYQWSTTETTATINVSPTTTTTYTVTVSDGGSSCSGTEDVVVTIANNISLLLTPVNPSICPGGNVPLTASGATSYTWSPGTGLSSTTGANVTASPGATTTYTVTGITGSSSATENITVTVANNLNVTVSPPNPFICQGGSIELVASGATNYTWSPASGLSATTGDTVIANPSATTVYTVNGTSGSCTGATTVTVNVGSNLNLSVNPATPDVCNGDSVQLTASGGSVGTTYTWSPANGLSGTTGGTVTATPTATTTYTVNSSDSSGCSGSTTVTVNVVQLGATVSTTDENCGHANGTATATVTDGTSPFSYSWSNFQSTSTITNLPANTYSVTVTDANGCTATASITINNIPPPVVTASSTDENCGHANGTASSIPNGGTAPYTYLWSNSQTLQNITNLPAGTYTVILTDANSCTVSASTTLINIAGPSVTINNIVNEMCTAENGSATVSANGGTPGYSYQWNSTPAQYSVTLQNVHAGTYTVTATDANGCTAMNTVTITDTPGPTVTTISSNEICGQANGTTTVSPFGGAQPYSYIWNNNQINQTAIGLVQGSYTVTVTDNNGCTISTSVNVMETYGPDAGFSAHPKILTIMDGPVSFLDNSSGNIVNWNWIFGDGSYGSGEETDHSYPNIGTYVVTLIVTDNNGCLDTTVDTIKVKDIFTLYIPNAFTPNADGYNDYFTPVGISVDPNKFEMYIFDRWGNVMFRTTEWNETLHQAKPWNGTKDNKGTYNDVVMDVYVYRIKVKEIDGPKHEYIGRISLIP